MKNQWLINLSVPGVENPDVLWAKTTERVRNLIMRKLKQSFGTLKWCMYHTSHMGVDTKPILCQHVKQMCCPWELKQSEIPGTFPKLSLLFGERKGGQQSFGAGGKTELPVYRLFFKWTRPNSSVRLSARHTWLEDGATWEADQAWWDAWSAPESKRQDGADSNIQAFSGFLPC